MYKPKSKPQNSSYMSLISNVHYYVCDVFHVCECEWRDKLTKTLCISFKFIPFIFASDRNIEKSLSKCITCSEVYWSNRLRVHFLWPCHSAVKELTSGTYCINMTINPPLAVWWFMICSLRVIWMIFWRENLLTLSTFPGYAKSTQAYRLHLFKSIFCS